MVTIFIAVANVVLLFHPPSAGADRHSLHSSPVDNKVEKSSFEDLIMF